MNNMHKSSLSAALLCCTSGVRDAAEKVLNKLKQDEQQTSDLFPEAGDQSCSPLRGLSDALSAPFGGTRDFGKA